VATNLNYQMLLKWTSSDLIVVNTERLNFLTHSVYSPIAVYCAEQFITLSAALPNSLEELREYRRHFLEESNICTGWNRVYASVCQCSTVCDCDDRKRWRR